MPGFTTVKRTGIELRAEFTATVDVELQLGNVAETITVSGEAPLVDTRSARAQTQYASETLESLPGNGRLATLISVLPGAVLNNEGDRASGALSDRSQTRFAIHGAPNAQPVIDGMNTEMAAANTGVFVWNGATFQEVVAETSGIGADRDTGGVQLNMIPKDGGNVFSGIANFAYTGPDLQSNNIGDDLIARGLNTLDAGSRLDQEVRRDRSRHRRPDQTEQALVLWRGSQEHHAAVRGGHLLEQAEAAGKHAVRTGPSRPAPATTSIGTTVFA